MAAALVAPPFAPVAGSPAGSAARPGCPVRPLGMATSADVPARRRLDGSVYRRRRIVAFLLVFEVALALALAAGGVSSALAGPPALASVGAGVDAPRAGEPPLRPDVIVVRPGDTLWSIARELDPDGDPRPLVAELAARAGGSALHPGQRLQVDGLR